MWHPWIYTASVFVRRAVRSAAWAVDPIPKARRRAAPLPHRVFKHTSKLLRNDPGVAADLMQGKVANLERAINWLVLHSELVILERHRHSFDPFPDNGRVLPFGSGATVFFNYLDYRVFNPTPARMQLRLWIANGQLYSELRSVARPPFAYHVYARGGRREGARPDRYRCTELWREVRARDGGREVLLHERRYAHRARIAYRE